MNGKTLNTSVFVGIAAVVLVSVQLAAQTTAQPPSPTQPSPDRGGNTPVPAAGAPAGKGAGTPGTVLGAPGPWVRPAAYPTKEVDPEKAARGKAIFGVTCSFCHGSDARGGEGGPNLIRSALALSDKDGELIAPVIQNGRVDRGMPKFDMTLAQISDIAAYIHSFKVGGYDISRKPPPSILVGNAAAGKTYFAATCGSCHSITGDLQGLATRITNPLMLQQAWIMPASGGRMRPGSTAAPTNVPPATVTVTLAGGETAEGKLDRIDDFIVSLTDAEGRHRTFSRDGDTPKVEIHDPLEAHRRLLPTYADKDIHDLTAYLETVK